MKPTLNIVDAQQMHSENPESFEVPAHRELDALGRDCVVKICVGNERFWTKIIHVDGEKITAIIQNDLLNTDQHGLNYNDVIEFEKKNVYSIWVDL